MSARLLILFCASVAIVATATAHGSRSDREQVVVIRAGQVITGTGETIDNGMIVIVDGVVAGVGRSIEHPRTARTIDASDQVVMPGFIHARTRQGLPGYQRSGQRSHLKVADEVYPSLIDFEEFLRSGITAVAFIPGGTGMPGRAAVYRTAGPDSDRQLRETAYIRVTMTTLGRDKAIFRSALQAAQREIEKAETARQEWEKKQAEEKKAAQEKQAEEKKPEGEGGGAAGDGDDAKKPAEPPIFTPPTIEPPLRPLVALLRGEAGEVAMIELNSASGLLHAEEVIARYKDLPVTFFIQPGAGDFHHVVERLGERKALVLTGPDMTRLPFTVVRYNLVAELDRAGAEVALVPSGSIEAMRTQLAELVRDGLPREAAIRAITVNPARVAGVEDRLGTIAVGKDADLIFLDGDPLNGLSRVTRTMIRGETVWSSGD